MLELIVVIVILGILSLLAIPSFKAVIGKAKQSTITQLAASIGREVDVLASFDSDAPNGSSGPDNKPYLTQMTDSDDFPSNSFVRSSSPPSWTYTPPSWSYTVGRTSIAGVYACLTLGTTYGERSVAVDGACAGFATSEVFTLVATDDSLTTTQGQSSTLNVLMGDTVNGNQVGPDDIVAGSVTAAAIDPADRLSQNDRGRAAE